ncbi:MAG: hypothetical protein ACI4NP_00485, partial [Thermoguttaceae bacterium]
KLIIQHPQSSVMGICNILKQNPDVVKRDRWIAEHAGAIPSDRDPDKFAKTLAKINEMERLLFRDELKKRDVFKRLKIPKKRFDLYYDVITLRRALRHEGTDSKRFLEDWLSKENVEFRQAQLLNIPNCKKGNPDNYLNILLPNDMYRRYLSIRNFKEKFGGCIPHEVMQNDELRHAWGIVD